MTEASTEAPGRTIAAIAVDMDRTFLNTPSRLDRPLAGTPILRRTVERVLQVQGIDQIVLMVADGHESRAKQILGNLAAQVAFTPLLRRPAWLDNRVRVGRGWNLHSWRGGAGQYAVFDEDFHPQSVFAALEKFAPGDHSHVLCVNAHAALIDVSLLSALVDHHRFKNHEMRYTYTAAAPGLCGILLQAPIVKDMAAANVLPGTLLGYDPKAPTFDSLIRDACMAVDPALSKIPNRFLLDTDRAWHAAEWAVAQHWPTLADMARAVAAKIQGSNYHQPRELEIELTPTRLTTPPGGTGCHAQWGRVPCFYGAGAPEKHVEGGKPQPILPPHHWTHWLDQQHFADDLLITLAGDGDPLLYPGLLDILRALRRAGITNIHLQTDLLDGLTQLWPALDEGLLDVLSITFWGDSPPTYHRVGGVDAHPQVMAHLTELMKRIGSTGRGIPLVVPRLLKVRDTIPELEPFFDKFTLALGWAVIDGPTDKCGDLPFQGVIDMAPPKRRPCRRLNDRLLIRSNGTALACSEDLQQRLHLGHIDNQTLDQLWTGQPLTALRQLHADARWNESPACARCREWHRP